MKERYSRLTEDEQRTHMTLWAMFKSPLMMGGNMPENTDFVNKLLTNKDVLDIDQHSADNRQLYRKGDECVWVSTMPDTKDMNVALFNLSDSVQVQTVSFAKGRWEAKDLWTGEQKGIVNGTVKATVPPHGTVLLRLHKK